MKNERDHWNQRYRAEARAAETADSFLVEAYREYLEPLFPQKGRVLDVAGGLGRHSFYLAEQGWQATLVDIAEVAVEQVRGQARARELAVEAEVADLTAFSGGSYRFDVVMVFFYLERRILAELEKALRPGGLLLYKTYMAGAAGLGARPTNPDHLLQPGELLRFFSDFRVLWYRETVRDRSTVEFVGRKPL